MSATVAVRRRTLATRRNFVVVPIMLFILFFWVYPFLWTIATSLKSAHSFNFGDQTSLIPSQFDLSNFSTAWTGAGFNIFFWNTILYTVASTVIELIKSMLCGYVLARYEFPGRKFLYGLVLGTLFLPLTSVIIPQYELVAKLGLLGSPLSIILVMSGAAGALYVLLFHGFFANLPRDLFDSANVDGAGFFRTFWLVAPLTKPVIAVVVILSFVEGWNQFQIPLVLAGQLPKLQSLPIGLYEYVNQQLPPATGFAAANVIGFIPMLIVFIAFQGFFVRGLAGAVKG
ncbi:MAG TPA: carbohydrate ABC transporter permease [Candidatus Dormibacteraeota bacterium]|jgi:raffinose/stachyose/melibiose transport system permease protein|nr:carbohydrate ABC transporter permease [Candidatus Dormibacteraeota bacterium]